MSKWWFVAMKVGDTEYKVPVFAINQAQAKRYAYLDYVDRYDPGRDWREVRFLVVRRTARWFPPEINGKRLTPAY